MSQARVNLNIEEVKDFLKHIITNNAFLQTKNKMPTAVNIEGPAGIGKTSAVSQLSKELDFNVVRLNLATIEELGDLIGFPIRQFQLCKQGTTELSEKIIQMEQTVTKKVMVPKMVTKVVSVNKPIMKQVMGANGSFVMKEVMVAVNVNTEVEEMVEETINEIILVDQVVLSGADSDKGACMWIDENAIEEYTKQGFKFTGEKRMSYCPPEWIAGMEDKPGILILDDYSRADQRFIQACMTLIETQKYISWELPKGWTILLTTNPDDGQYLVTPMDIAQKTRFITVNLKFDAEIWAKWAEKEGIDGRCINFLLLHPEMVTETCNARAIVTFFNAISSIPDFSKELGLVQMIGEGSVGPEFSTMFSIFINNKLDKLVTPKDMLLNDNEIHIIGELRSCIGSGNDYRADIASILVTRLINFTINYAENNSIHQKTIDRLIKLSTDKDTFTDDLKYVLVKKVLNGNKQKFQKLMSNNEVMQMAMK